MVRFIDRIEEIATLEKDAKLENAFIVVYGRRRIGKTRLIEEFLKGKNVIRCTAEDTNKKIQLNEIKSIFAHYLKDEFLEKEDISDWSSFFGYLAKTLNKERNLYIWIDEFSYLIKNDSVITSVLQKFIDSFLRESKIFLIISGSLFGLMNEKVLSHASPLYGRRTRDMLVKQIPVKYINDFLNFSFEDTLKIILTIGGIPEYLMVASKYKNYTDFIINEFLKRDGYFVREPYFLLSQEFKEIKTYFSIMNAIAYRNNKPTEIANFVGIKAREIYPYLELLISYGFIRRTSSIIEDKKGGAYFINDAFFDLWFNLVHKNREQIEKGLYNLDLSQLNSFLGKRFEMFINDNFNLFFNIKTFTKNGKWWGHYRDESGRKALDLDVIAINEKFLEILFGECKWQENVNSLSILNEIKEKTKYVSWNNENRKESYAIFARSFSRKIEDFEGKKVYCLDLKDIEKRLRHSGKAGG